jgi:excinuclease ABC subunit C
VEETSGTPKQSETQLRSGDLRRGEPNSVSGELRRGEGTILYIGKATSLRDRVRSYFTQDLSVTRGPKIVRMLERATDIRWQTTDSVLEALLLESHLIKRHQPPYNTDEKDDKSYTYVVVTREKFPRVLLIRGRDLVVAREGASESVLGALEDFSGTVPARSGREKASREAGATLGRRQATKTLSLGHSRKSPYKYIFGPFPSGGALKEALKIVRRIFPYRDKCLPAVALAKEGLPATAKPCFNAQLGLCPGVCVGKVDAREYAKTIRNIRMFFEGKKGTLVKRIEREMHEAARQMQFEKAHEMKKTLFALGHIRDVSLLKKDFLRETSPAGAREGLRFEAYDVAHLSGREVVGVMTVVEGGERRPSEYRKFILQVEQNNDVASLEEILRRRLQHHEWPLPDLIVIDGGAAQLQTAERVLGEYGLPIPLVSVVKDERHQPRDILGPVEWTGAHREAILLANSEAHRFAITFHRARRKKGFLPH